MDTTAREETIPRTRAGFTVVEIIIAVIVLAFGILGMAGTTAYVVRNVTLADATAKRAQALQSVIERLRAAGYDSLAVGSLGTGSDSVGPFAVKWSTTVDGTRSVLVTIVTSGPGLASVPGSAPILSNQVVDTFTYRVIRP